MNCLMIPAIFFFFFQKLYNMNLFGDKQIVIYILFCCCSKLSQLNAHQWHLNVVILKKQQKNQPTNKQKNLWQKMNGAGVQGHWRLGD